MDMFSNGNKSAWKKNAVRPKGNLNEPRQKQNRKAKQIE